MPEPSFDEITFIAESGEVRRQGRKALLTRTEIDIFDSLQFCYPRHRTREKIYNDVYELRGNEPDARIIDVRLVRMREKLAPLGILIESKHSFGWRLRLDALPDEYTEPSSETVRTKPVAVQPEPASHIETSNPVDPCNAVAIGRTDAGALDLDLARLIDGRLLVQGASGAGKSWTLRRLLEQTRGRIQQIVVDPEGEFRSLAEACGLTIVEGHRLDATAIAIAAARARTHRISLLLDLSEATRDQQLQAVTSLFATLVDAPRADWHPCLVVVDEAHLFAPLGSHTIAEASVRKAAVAALTDLMSRGRKRGLCGVLATQRLARLAKSVVSEAQNFLVGLNTLDLDIRRAAETIGWDANRAFDRLPALPAGNFVAVGPAFSRQSSIVKVGGVNSEHRGARPEMSSPDALDADTVAGLLDLEALIDAAAEDAAVRREDALPVGTKSVRAFIRNPAFSLAGAAFAQLVPLSPAGARISDLETHLDVDATELHGALALLDLYGAVDFIGDGPERAVRVVREMLP